MSRTEVTVSATPPGAGRIVDYLWPAPFDFATNSAGVMRTDFTQNPITGPTFAAGGGGAASSIVVDGGVVAVSINTNAVVADGSGVGFINKRIPIITAKNLGGNLLSNDLLCWRLIWIAAAVAPPALAGEMTLACVSNVNQILNWITTLNPGFGFQFLNSGAVNFSAVGGAGLKTTPVTGVGFDATKFHGYEMRIVGASNTAEAQVSVLVDGVPVALPAAFSAWGAGSNLPGITALGGTPGFTPNITNSSKFANSLHIHQFRSIAGPTPSSLL